MGNTGGVNIGKFGEFQNHMHNYIHILWTQQVVCQQLWKSIHSPSIHVFNPSIICRVSCAGFYPGVSKWWPKVMCIGCILFNAYINDLCKNCTGQLLEVLATFNYCWPVWAEPCIWFWVGNLNNVFMDCIRPWKFYPKNFSWWRIITKFSL